MQNSRMGLGTETVALVVDSDKTPNGNAAFKKHKQVDIVSLLLLLSFRLLYMVRTENPPFKILDFYT